MRQITHQSQPTWNTCMSACIAMLLDKPVDEVVAEFHEDYITGTVTPARYMWESGIEFRVPEFNNLDTPRGELNHGELYLLSTPSMNNLNSMHAVIVDLRDGVKIYDPNGNPDYRYSQFASVEGLADSDPMSAKMLRHWAIEAVVDL